MNTPPIKKPWMKQPLINTTFLCSCGLLVLPGMVQVECWCRVSLRVAALLLLLLLLRVVVVLLLLRIRRCADHIIGRSTNVA